eukprot:CAMPEP_0202858064 /NCGR_PEP_ID=MMETSP1391-20130828/748_1 /ASSEMBLY_ACC=CAM_ASM_000867 /TAXON_ID=1034604 /ORGANISM="Chlamydomonas leiostraca, Strain SAG 11-49" /LENGTH=339 /DNA_ID=CAMNT_0049536935 /DNA_START=131 /DNA_END=1148 /DNA_ORIENTATION=-
MWPSPHNGYTFPTAQQEEEMQNQQASYLGNSIFLLVLILILFNPPPGFVLLFFVMIIVMSCMRAIQLHRAIGRAEDALGQLPVTARDGSSRQQAHAGLLRLIRSGQLMVLPQQGARAAGARGANGRAAVEPAELELLLLTELAQAAAVRSHAQAAQAAANALSDQDLATLPCAPYKKPPGCSSSSAPPAAAAPSKAADDSKVEAAGEEGAGDVEEGEAGAAAVVPAAAEAAGSEGGASKESDGGLVCSICLDPVEEGAMVMTLPCLHQYHGECVEPWLRQQGRGAECPMCKTQVFPATAGDHPEAAGGWGSSGQAEDVVSADVSCSTAHQARLVPARFW